MLCTIRSSAGRIQVVGSRSHVAIDVQGCNRGVDGFGRNDHGFIRLRHAEARELRNVLSRLLASDLGQEARGEDERQRAGGLSRDAA